MSHSPINMAFLYTKTVSCCLLVFVWTGLVPMIRGFIIPISRVPMAHQDHVRQLKDSSAGSDFDSFQRDPAYRGMSHGERAAELKRRAKELMKEAKAMEVELLEAKRGKKRKRGKESFDFIDRLFLNRPLTPESVARTMRDERWSSDLAMAALESLQSRLKEANEEIHAEIMNQTIASRVSEKSVSTNGRNATESALLIENYMRCFLLAADILDSEALNRSNREGNVRWPERTGTQLRSHLKDLEAADEFAFQTRLAENMKVTVGKSTGGNTNIRRNIGLLASSSVIPTASDLTVNVTDKIPRFEVIPQWIPSNMLPLVLQCPDSLDPADVNAIRDILSTGSFFCTSSDSFQKGAIFRGNTRKSRNETTSDILQEVEVRLEKEGLSDRVRMFYLPNPELVKRRSPASEPGDSSPVLIAVPKTVNLTQVKRWRKIFRPGQLSSFLTLFSLYGYSVSCYALNPVFFNSLTEQHDIRSVVQCLPLCGMLLAIHASHELAHYFVARSRGIKLERPIAVPNTQLGTFGCITKLKSFPRNRKDFLDVALAGPLASFFVSLGMIMAGIRMAVGASKSTIEGLPMVPNTVLQSSSLIASILAYMAPKVLTMPAAQPIPMHSLFFAGYSGLISSALNMLPIFRLDGGRAHSAVKGSRAAAFLSVAVILFIASFGLKSTLGNTWLLYVLFFQRSPPVPCLDEVTPVGRLRTGVWYASLVLVAITILPFPRGTSLLL